MQIIKATVLLTNGSDQILLDTDYPSSFVKEFSPSQSPLQLRFDATANTGVDYCRKHFGVEPEIVRVSG